MSYFREPYICSKIKIKVEFDLPNQATKPDLNNVTGFDTSKFPKKTDLTSLKSDIDKLDIDKLEKVSSGSNSFKSKVDKLDVDKLKLVSTDLNKLSDVVNKKAVKKDVYDKFLNKFSAIDASGFVKKQNMMLRSMRLMVKYLV